MKTITVTKALKITDVGDPDPKFTGLEIDGPEQMEASDGYHTFGQLYDHRIALYIALCAHIVERKVLQVWRSKLHSDGTGFDGWFILGINKKKGDQITYHLPNEKWDYVGFAETLQKAPEFDGHSSSDVLERIKALC